jgi:hypothetical protein
MTPRDALQYRCKHGNSDVPGEEEFLFAPHSVFTVISLIVPQTPTDGHHVVLRLKAAVDNLKESEDLCAASAVVLKLTKTTPCYPADARVRQLDLFALQQLDLFALQRRVSCCECNYLHGTLMHTGALFNR